MSFNLPVSFFSQRDNSYIWHYRYEESITDEDTNEVLHKKGEQVFVNEEAVTEEIADGCCNITCLAMVLNYLGITTDTPELMSRKIFADSFSDTNKTAEADFDRYISFRKKTSFGPTEGNRCIESAEVIKSIALEIYNIRNACALYNYTLQDVKKEVEAGYPVIVNCGITRPSKEWMQYQVDNKANYNTDTVQNSLKCANKDSEWEYHGHYIVVTGFTDDGKIIINDPWGKATNNAGTLPQQLINDHPEDAWGYYNSNIPAGTNKGEHIVLSEADFNRQYHDKLYSVIIIYERRWSFPFENILTNFIKTSSGNNKRIVPSPDQVKNTFCFESKVSRFPISTLGIPHNGIDLNNKQGVSVHSIGSGIVIAAKLCLKANEDLPCGSNCFVLIKHSVFDTTKKLKVFFVLFEHLKPLVIGNSYTNVSFVDELLHESVQENSILKQEALNKLEDLRNGETVIFNNEKIVSEVADNSIVGYVGTKGFLPWNEENRIHFEIFSNENLLKNLPEYKEIDITKIQIYDRSKIIESYKDILFGDFSKDSNLSEYVKHLDKNAISREGVDAFFNSTYADIAEKIVVISKSLWDSNRNFPEEFSNRRGLLDIVDEYVTSINDYDKECVKPYLWWTNIVDDAINKDLTLKINQKQAFFFHPISFLYWLMKNDEEVYKLICPNSYQRELNNNG